MTSILPAPLLVRLRAAWPIVTAFALSVIWLPALRRGFSADDFWEVPLTWSQFRADPLINEARPTEALTFVLLPSNAFVQHAANLGLYWGGLWLMWRVCRLLKLSPWSTFMALSAFFHPAFLWSVTWIVQRADLLVIVTILAALGTTSVPARLALIVIGSGARTPHIFQNLVFAYQFARRGHRVAAAVALLCLAIFLAAGYAQYSQGTVGEDVLGNLPLSSAMLFVLRLAKLLEGVAYVFAPIPMFAVTWWGPLGALLAYTACWSVLLWSPEPIPTRLTGHGTLVMMAAAMYIPFVIASEVRVTAEAAAVTFLAAAPAARWRVNAKLALIGILMLHLTGIGLNYGLFASQEYDIAATPTTMERTQPVFAYEQWRRHVVRTWILETLGVLRPVAIRLTRWRGVSFAPVRLPNLYCHVRFQHTSGTFNCVRHLARKLRS